MDMREGKLDAAMERVAALKKSHPGEVAVHALEGELYAVSGRYSEAASAYEQAFATRPSASLAAKAYQVRLAGKLAEPEKPLAKWVESQPADIGSRLLLAEALVRSGAHQDAVTQYQVILKARPQDVAALNNLAWLYHELGDARAVELARRAAELAPESVAVTDTLGWILLERGALEEGLNLLKLASSQPQATAEIQYHYAVALARTGSKDEARRRLEGLLQQERAFAGRAAAQQLFTQLSAGGTAARGNVPDSTNSRE
jgi:predicted Zn-dependent protease